MILRTMAWVDLGGKALRWLLLDSNLAGWPAVGMGRADWTEAARDGLWGGGRVQDDCEFKLGAGGFMVFLMETRGQDGGLL